MHPPGGGGGRPRPGLFQERHVCPVCPLCITGSDGSSAKRTRKPASRARRREGGVAVAATGPASVRREELVGDVAECLRRAGGRAVDAAGATAGRRPLVSAAGLLRLREGVNRLREDPALG